MKGRQHSRDRQRLDELVARTPEPHDALILVIERTRTTTYGRVCGFSPCQLELLAVDIDRAVRGLTRAARQPGHTTAQEELCTTSVTSTAPPWRTR